MGVLKTNNERTKDSSHGAEDSAASAVQVYLRVRPLIPEEKGHALMQYREEKGGHEFRLKLPGEQTQLNPAFSGANAPPLRRRDQYKSYGGYTSIFRDQSTNEDVYQTAIQPLLPHVVGGANSACVFTYGHTGSGKSHTLLGYDDQDMGVYKYAVQSLFEKMEGNCWILLRITELYKDHVKDLLTGAQCCIRQDGHGIAQVRGPMKEDKDGRITQQPLGALCHTPEECIKVAHDCISTRRRVGTSTHHSQSSRSHLVIELEVVTPELIEQRHLLVTQQAELTRLKWLQTERMFNKTRNTVMPKWTKEYTRQKNCSQLLRKDIQKYEDLVKETRKLVAATTANKKLGGTLVFCDLAGNEYARDASTPYSGSCASSKAEFEEAVEINKSLLAVKEMIRNLQKQHSAKNKQQHVPYRDSKLTMMLRRHLDTKAVMLAHISPSQESLRKTINTLKYSSMVGR